MNYSCNQSVTQNSPVKGKSKQDVDLVQILEREIYPRLTAELVYNWTGHDFQRSGNRLRGKPPWGQSKSGNSFTAFDDLGFLDAHNGGETGNPVKYRHSLKVRQYEYPKGRDWLEIVQELASEAGVTLPEREWTPAQIEKARRRESRQAILRAVQEYCASILWTARGENERQHLIDERGFTSQGLTDLGIGLYPSVKEVREVLQAKGLDLSLAKQVGVLAGKWEGYMIFPWSNPYSEPLTLYGHQSKEWAAATGKPKKYALFNPKDNGKAWLHTKESPYLFNRVIRSRHKEVVLVEGITDAAIAHQFGDTRVIGCVAAMLSLDQCETMARHRIEKVTIALDPDALSRLMSEGIDYSCTQKALEDIQAENSHLFQFTQDTGLSYEPNSTLTASAIWAVLEEWYLANGTLAYEESTTGKHKPVWMEQANPYDRNVKGANQVLGRFQQLFPKAKRVVVPSPDGKSRHAALKGLGFNSSPPPEEPPPGGEPPPDPVNDPTRPTPDPVNDPINNAKSRVPTHPTQFSHTSAKNQNADFAEENFSDFGNPPKSLNSDTPQILSRVGRDDQISTVSGSVTESVTGSETEPTGSEDAIASGSTQPTPAKNDSGENAAAKESFTDYEDVIAAIDRQMKRLGWTKQQGRDYLINKYGSRSRQLLTDEELLSFLSHLKSNQVSFKVGQRVRVNMPGSIRHGMIGTVCRISKHEVFEGEIHLLVRLDDPKLKLRSDLTNIECSPESLELIE